MSRLRNYIFFTCIAVLLLSFAACADDPGMTGPGSEMQLVEGETGRLTVSGSDHSHFGSLFDPGQTGLVDSDPLIVITFTATDFRMLSVNFNADTRTVTMVDAGLSGCGWRKIAAPGDPVRGISVEPYGSGWIVGFDGVVLDGFYGSSGGLMLDGSLRAER